ncbi:MAG TPA: GerMN domain-containing protein, partial [Patescibacteria group bacterium]|nr:GerMN domain-containing protein [Patescibacteria group bacterium]
NLDRNTWTLEVDFSKELLTEMNAGSSLEGEILKSLVNTLGEFYDVDKVYITVEGQPYESGHFAISSEEFFKVDKDGIKEFNE